MDKNSEIKNTGVVEKVANGAAGIIIGVGCGSLLIILGVALSLSIIGAIFGIPLVIIGLGFIIGGPLAGFLVRSAECPYCKNKISIPFGRKAIDCKVCKKRLLIQGKRPVMVE